MAGFLLPLPIPPTVCWQKVGWRWGAPQQRQSREPQASGMHMGHGRPGARQSPLPREEQSGRQGMPWKGGDLPST